MAVDSHKWRTDWTLQDDLLRFTMADDDVAIYNWAHVQDFRPEPAQ